MPLPSLSEEQRREALAKAAEAPKKRAEIKAKLKSGSLGLNDILTKADGDETVGKMKVSAMLEALPGVGKVRAQKVMEELNISPSRRLRGLGDKQRQALRERFGNK
jgi:signal recognition particle GTPase